jgi:hypothetical protein
MEVRVMAVAISSRASKSIELIQNELNVLREELERTSFHLGMAFEKELFAMCVSRCMSVKKVRQRGSVDLIVNGKTVQCKAKHGTASDVGIYGGNKLSYDKDAFDVLAVRVGEKMYFVPSASLNVRSRGKLRTKVKVSAIKKWLDAWHVFDSHAYVVELSLFSHLPEEVAYGC